MTEQAMLIDILALLAAAVVAVPLFQRLGLSSVLGYLAAGAVLGTWGLELIEDSVEIRQFAELGVIFLLFLIGIEIKPSRLWVMRRWVFGLGLGQMLITGGLLMAMALYVDIAVFPAFIIGFGLAMSSTAFALQLLAEKHELPTITGRIGLSVLLQDLAVVPLMALVSLAGQDIALGISMARAILEAVIVVSCFILTGRYLLNPLLDLVAASKNSEVFIAAALLLVLGSAKIMAMFGLSMAMGAFLAGLMLAESHYRHQLVADIQPFRGILLGLFFMSVGISLNFGLLLQQYPLILALVCTLMTVKTLVLWGLCRLSHLNNNTSLRIALLLFQGGEFGFVLFALAMLKGILSITQFQMLILTITITMILTPLVIRLGDWLLRRKVSDNDAIAPVVFDLDHKQPHVIIAGFGRVGKRIAALTHMAKIPYLALDFNLERVEWGKEQGFNVYYGNASRLEVLRSAGIENASMLVAALDNDQHTEQLVCLVHHSFPKLVIHARARDSKHCQQLLRYGARNVVSENLEASLRLGELVLTENGIARKKLQRLPQEYREQYYQKMAITAKTALHNQGK